MKTMHRRRADTIAECLGAAQAHADRFFGDAPAPHWRPARRGPPSWPLAMALAAVLATALALVWSLGTASGIGPGVILLGDTGQRSAAGPRTMLAHPVAVPPTPQTAADCSGPDCTAAATGEPLPAHFGGKALFLAQPADPDAWALDPQPIASLPVPVARMALHNIPWAAAQSGAADDDAGAEDEDPGGGHDE